jgi:transcription initiation factor IIE alpha subunit
MISSVISVLIGDELRDAQERVEAFLRKYGKSTTDELANTLHIEEIGRVLYMLAKEKRVKCVGRMRDMNAVEWEVVEGGRVAGVSRS